MTNYLIGFSVYTLAMIGVLCVALFVFKAFSNKCFSKKSSMLKVEDSMNLSPRKTLYVISTGKEKFLVAADADRTSLISKLDSTSEAEVVPIRKDQSSNLTSFDGIESLSEFSALIASKEKGAKEPMLRGLARKLSAV